MAMVAAVAEDLPVLHRSEGPLVRANPLFAVLSGWAAGHACHRALEGRTARR